MILWLIILFSVLGNVATVLIAAVVLTLDDRRRRRVIPFLVSYATGTLLGAAFLGMIPRCFSGLPSWQAATLILTGLLAFYVLESLLIVRHCHEPHCEYHTASGPLILLGDGVHNFADGVVIAASFAVSVPFGVAMSIAVIAHEVPQELGDFGILLEHGYTKGRALAYNTISGAAAVVGALLTFVFVQSVTQALPYVLAISASSFIYIALADLIPTHRGQAGIKNWLVEFGLMVLGIGTVAFLRFEG
jgi:zinc and cadmium transporter